MFNNENNFWVGFWTLAGIVLIALTTLGVYAGHIEDQKVVDLVSNGADPIVAKCSLELSDRGAIPLICVEALKNASK